MVWAAGLLLLYAGGGCLGVKLLRGYAAEAAKTREARIEALSVEPKAQVPDLQIPTGAKPVDVLVGSSINQVGEFAMKESAWTADFNLWFSWSSDAVKPDEGFCIVNGEILQQNKTESSQSGNERYVEYHVVARMTRAFDASRFPFGEEGLLIQVEDATDGAEQVRYVADKHNSEISPGASPRAGKLTRFLVDTRTSGYRSGRAIPGGSMGGRSQFMVGMLIVPDGMGLYRRLFQALFASVAVTLIALYIKPTHVDCRFGLPVGGLFATVSNNIFVGTLLPYADCYTLTDMINTVSLLTIFLVLVQLVISLHIFDSMGRERLSRFFDRVSFAVFLLGYVAVNLALPFAARPS